MAYLGIAQTNHGSSAALYDGKRLFAANEERFDRVKFSSGYPRRAIDWCLKEAGIKMHDVKSVGFYMSAANFLASTKASHNDSWRYYPESLYTVPSEIFKKLGGREYSEIKHIKQTLEFFDGKAKDIYFVDHHLAHAATSFLQSGMDSAMVLCIDGNGDGSTMSWVEATGSELQTVFRQPFPHSIGQLYAAFTQYLGFSANSDEYKVMGMAAYGDPKKYYEPVRNMVKLHSDGSFELDMSYFSFNMQTERLRYSRKLPEAMKLDANSNTESVNPAYCDIAASVQAVLEEVFTHVLTALSKRSKEKNLCYGGGVALNCLANGKILPTCSYKNIFIPPNPGDPGLAIGVAAYMAHVIDGIPRGYVYNSDYLGPEYSEDYILKVLKENNLAYSQPSDIVSAVAERLSKSQVVGLFQGRQEFGPRALGNRSILADPRSESMKDIVNRKIKFREPFRPFAPAVTMESASKIYELEGRTLNESSPENFMLSTAFVKPEWRKKIQATTHNDGTARLQVVSHQKNALFHKIISAFGSLTGTDVVMNTSFNVKDEPIVLTPEHAVRCFYTTGMDALALGPYLLVK